MTDQPARSSRPGDELTRIKGIKEARQQLLRDKLGIRTFRDLANASPEVILSLFRAENHPVSRSTVEMWIQEAALLASADIPLVSEQTLPPPANDEWHAFALFVVEFQERTTLDGTVERRINAHHMETDHNAVWVGTDCQPIAPWIASELGEHNIAPEPSLSELVGTTTTLTTSNAEAPSVDERLERLLATVQRLNPTVNPLSPIAPPPVDTFSPILTHLIQRTNVPMENTAAAPAPTAPPPTAQTPVDTAFSPTLIGLIQRVSLPVEPPPPARAAAPVPHAPIAPADAVFSPMLQQLLAKFRQPNAQRS